MLLAKKANSSGQTSPAYRDSNLFTRFAKSTDFARLS